MHRRLRQQALDIGCWVMNRMRPYTVLPLTCGDDLVAQVETAMNETPVPSDLKSRRQTAEKIASLSSVLAELAQQDQRLHARLVATLPESSSVVTVPRTRDEPIDVAGLRHVADLLCAETRS